MKQMEIYLHIPFCVKKCAYCDFLSMPAESDVRGAYIEKLKSEIRLRGPACRDWEVVSVFIGGGTPSILYGRQIEDVMRSVREYFNLRPDAEITVECNPGTLTEDKLESYRRAGVNRLSIGLQSASEKELKLLGRIHTYADFLESYECARNCGFSNINVDLMSGLPGQSTRSWEQTLRKVAMLKPEHISAYSLIIEEGTPFYGIYGYDDETRKKGEKPLFLPSEEDEREMYHFTRDFLAGKGYARYEISNYAKPGRECIHNIGYWTRREYLGMGLGAASLMNNRRFSNERNLEAYMKGNFDSVDVEKLSNEDQMEEFMFLGLRMTGGIRKSDFLKNFFLPISYVYGDVIQKLEKEGLLEENAERIWMTERGTDLGNYVFAAFML